MIWSAPIRPVAHAEQALVTAILEGVYPADSTLPAERELSIKLGITRPTLREAIRRLESDGWLDVQQGKPTRVRNFWREGGLNVLSSLVRYSQELPNDFITNLLELRLVLAPAYARAAVLRAPQEVVACLDRVEDLEDTPTAMAAFDWRLHSSLTWASGNPIYTLILNGFAGFYEEMAQQYFGLPASRQSSRRFYLDLLQAARQPDAQAAEAVTRQVMLASIHLWNETSTPVDKE